jgi:hypothetical protein
MTEETNGFRKGWNALIHLWKKTMMRLHNYPVYTQPSLRTFHSSSYPQGYNEVYKTAQGAARSGGPVLQSIGDEGPQLREAQIKKMSVQGEALKENRL